MRLFFTEIADITRTVLRITSPCLAFVLLAGCREQTNATTAGSASAPAASSSAPVVRIIPRMALPSAPPPAAHQETVAVKFYGSIKPTTNAKNTVVFASFDDCSTGTAPNIGQVDINPDGTFKLEIFARWGADYTVCAVEQTAPGKPTKRYGKAPAVYSPRDPGDARIRDLVIDIATGPARTFPGPRPSGGF